MFLSQLTGNKHSYLLGLLAGVLFTCLFCLGLLVCEVWLFEGGRRQGWDGMEVGGVF